MICAHEFAVSRNPESTRVLIVEDELAALTASESYLACCGFSVATAANEEEALGEAADQAPDVVVCDWQLGEGCSGVEVARSLQKRYDCAVVFITAYPLAGLRTATDDLDVICYLRKPFALSVLAAAIGKA